MSNDYYNADTLIPRHSKVKSPVVNSIALAIAAAFSLFPGKDKLRQNRVTHYQDMGAADAYVVTMAPVPEAYAEGMHLRVVIANTNTGAATINVNSLGVRAIKIFNNTDPAAGDITAGDIIDLVFHSSRDVFMMTSQSRGFVAGAEAYKDAAADSALAASESETGAEEAYIAFSKRMLGEHAEDPTTDNQGDPLITSAIYWKTGEGWRVYDGSGFNPAVFDTSGAMFADRNLSDLDDAAEALTALGFSSTAAEMNERPKRARLFSLWTGA